MNDWHIVHLAKHVEEMAISLGFTVEQGRENTICIKANRPPYADDITVYQCISFDLAIAWLTGYAQLKFEIANTK